MIERERDGLFGGLFLIVLGVIVFAASTVPPGSLGGLVVGPFLVLLAVGGMALIVRERIKRWRHEAAHEAAWRAGRWADSLCRGFPEECFPTE